MYSVLYSIHWKLVYTYTSYNNIILIINRKRMFALTLSKLLNSLLDISTTGLCQGQKRTYLQQIQYNDNVF